MNLHEAEISFYKFTANWDPSITRTKDLIIDTSSRDEIRLGSTFLYNETGVCLFNGFFLEQTVIQTCLQKNSSKVC